jgi:RNA polymerase sigma-70 factor (ECF subfamily)
MVAKDNERQLTDEEHVKAIIDDPQSFVYIVETYEKPLLRFIHRISSVSEEDAKDILQDAFIKMYRNVNSFDAKWKFSSWAYRITRHEVIDHFRKKKVRPQINFSDLGDAVIGRFSAAIDIEEEIHTSISKEKLLELLDELDYKYKEILVLKFLEEKSYEEMSDIIKKPIGTIGTRINRAKRQLSKIAKAKNVFFDI